MDTITSNSFPLFRDIGKKKKSKSTAKIKMLRSDCALFSNLFIAAQNRPGIDLDKFFENENQPFPPSISENGFVRSGSKSDILPLLENLNKSTSCSQPDTTCAILDGPPIVHIVKKRTSTTFGEYAHLNFIPYIRREYEIHQRIDLVFDVYKDDSLKAFLRQERGTGMRQKVQPNIILPKNWESFLKVDDNKSELFKFLAIETTKEFSNQNQLLICTVGDECISNKKTDLGMVSPCDHEEADSRIFVHLDDAISHGHKKILIRTVDSDVLNIAVGMSHLLVRIEELWVAFGTGKNFR